MGHTFIQIPQVCPTGGGGLGAGSARCGPAGLFRFGDRFEVFQRVGTGVPVIPAFEVVYGAIPGEGLRRAFLYTLETACLGLADIEPALPSEQGTGF